MSPEDVTVTGVTYLPKGREFRVEADYHDREYSIRLTRELTLPNNTVPLWCFEYRRPTRRMTPHSDFGKALVARMVEIVVAEDMHTAAIETERAKREAVVSAWKALKARKRVRSAAPELLAALRWYVEEHGYTDDARAAIAKAEGTV